MTLFSIVVDDIMTHYKKNHEATALADPESDRGPDPDPEKMKKEMEKIIHLVVDLEDMKSRIGKLRIAGETRYFEVKELAKMVQENACELQYDVEWQACLIHYQVLRGSDSTEIPAYDFFLEKKDEKKDEKGHDKLTNRCQQYYRGKGEAFAPFIAMRAYCVLLHRYLNTSSCAGKVVCRTSYRIVSNHIASIHVVVVYPIFIIYLLTNFNSCSSYYLFIHSFIHSFFFFKNLSRSSQVSTNQRSIPKERDIRQIAISTIRYCGMDSSAGGGASTCPTYRYVTFIDR